MPFKFNPFTGKMDTIRSRNFGTSGFQMVDANGVTYTITIDTSGNLVTDAIVAGGSGEPIGLLLALTYP